LIYNHVKRKTAGSKWRIGGGHNFIRSNEGKRLLFVFTVVGSNIGFEPDHYDYVNPRPFRGRVVLQLLNRLS